jgi:hypothetical protein
MLFETVVFSCRDLGIPKGIFKPHIRFNSGSIQLQVTGIISRYKPKDITSSELYVSPLKIDDTEIGLPYLEVGLDRVSVVGL